MRMKPLIVEFSLSWAGLTALSYRRDTSDRENLPLQRPRLPTP